MKQLCKPTKTIIETLKAKLREISLRNPRFRREVADWQFRQRVVRFHGRWRYIFQSGMMRI